MSDERGILFEAARALRSTHEEGAATPHGTRHRILVSLDRRRRTRQTLGTALVTLVAISTASTAWAAATGRLPLPRVIQWFGRETVSAPLAHVPTASRSVPTAEAIVPLIAQSAAGAAADETARPESISPAPVAARVEAVVVQPRGATRVRVGQLASAARPTRAAAIAQGPSDLEIEDLYRDAHAAHFVTRDPSAALAAWERYLAAAPDGRFGPEARYNRALTLVRLQRRDDALEALRPFAAAADGAYRQREAAALTAALESRR